MRLAAVLRPNPLGSYSTFPCPLAVKKGERKRQRGRNGLAIVGRGRKGEEKDVKG